jgi:catechol 2,3-dioxygenase-like lactoylglutathione lyase family enzyme
MAAIAHLFAVTLDCPDPIELARFYKEFTGCELSWSNQDFVVLTGDGNVRLDFQRVPNHQPPLWPDPTAPRRLHLDFSVDNLAQAETQLLALGAVLPQFQPGRQRFRVLLDPAGHPFCLATKAAAAAPSQPHHREERPHNHPRTHLRRHPRGPGRRQGPRPHRRPALGRE